MKAIEEIQEKIEKIVTTRWFGDNTEEEKRAAREEVYALQREMKRLAGINVIQNEVVTNILTEGYGW